MSSIGLYLSTICLSEDGKNVISNLMDSITKDKKVALYMPIKKSNSCSTTSKCEYFGNIPYGISEDEAISLIASDKYSTLVEKIITNFNTLKIDNDIVVCIGQNTKTLNSLLNKNINTELAKHLQTLHVSVVDCDGKDREFVEQLLCAKEISYSKSALANVATLLKNAPHVEGKQNLFYDKFDDKLNDIINIERKLCVTPIAFEYKLMQRAKADKKMIILPESKDDRVLKAASILLERDVCNITLLGDEEYIKQKADELSLDLTKATVLNPLTSPLHAEFSNEFFELRKSKGMTLEKAGELMNDLNYFATMLIHTKKADGMVSGAIHTTADTIRPALQIIKTKPGISIISSVFFMCLENEVLVYGDCAINPQPSSAELAQIAISSAQTSRAFGIEPKVAMLSYSTGTSGKGEDVEKVITATELIKEQDDNILVEGPIQYDAAIDKDVAKTKLPNSKVAGMANVFIFPDLNSGNIGYKAVQRSSGALAIGPVLQGLNKPVNDLSRGCLVEDIVNTVAITAIQAQGE